MWLQPFLHIIYAYMITFTLFICLIQIQNSKICYRILQISKKKKTIYVFFAHIAQSYFEETCIC